MKTLLITMLAFFITAGPGARAAQEPSPKRPLYEKMEIVSSTGVRKPVYSKPISDKDRARYNKSISELGEARTEIKRFYALGRAAKDSFSAGAPGEAYKYAEELAAMAGKYRNNWNYGNAVHDSNMVLGRLALGDNNLQKAIALLLKAGDTPGSPQLGSFGPNMSLAKDLLERGERKAVLQYFKKCAVFWDMGKEKGTLDLWTKEVEAGRIPEFGANLLY